MGTAIMSTRPTTTPSPELTSGLYRMTVHQYDRMIDDGSIAEDDRVELIEGLLLNKMGRKRPHIVAGNKGLRMLSGIVPNGWYVAKEDPIVVSDWSKPEPDLAVVRGQAEDYIERDVTATDVALVIEIAESSLAIDQTDMTRVYAASEIPFYWIVNLVGRQLEVYSNPGPISYSSLLTSQTWSGCPSRHRRRRSGTDRCRRLVAVRCHEFVRQQVLPVATFRSAPDAVHNGSNSSHFDGSASEGIRQSPRGDRLTVPTLGPSGMHDRLYCWRKNRV